MKQLIIAILIIPLLGMVPPDEKKQRKVVEHYVATLLNTKDENIKDVFSLMKITEEHEERLMNELTDILLFTIGTPKSLEISSPTFTRSFAALVIFL